jgi:hypothetical protein
MFSSQAFTHKIMDLDLHFLHMQRRSNNMLEANVKDDCIEKFLLNHKTTQAIS